MGERNLREQIMDLFAVASKPLGLADIRRRLDGGVDPGEISSRLCWMLKRNKIGAVMMDSQAITGPRRIKGWYSPGNQEVIKYINSIAQTQEKGEPAVRQVASADSADEKAA